MSFPHPTTMIFLDYAVMAVCVLIIAFSMFLIGGGFLIALIWVLNKARSLNIKDLNLDE